MKSSVKMKLVKVTSHPRSMYKRNNNLSVVNKILSTQINKQRIAENTPILEVGENSIVKNLDYNNPQQLKWLED